MEVLSLYMRMWSMFVHYDFMKKEFQGSSLDSSLEVFQLRMWDFSVSWEIEKTQLGHWIDGFYMYA